MTLAVQQLRRNGIVRLKCAGKATARLPWFSLVDVQHRRENAPAVRSAATEKRHILLVKANPQNYRHPRLLDFLLNYRFYVGSDLLRVSPDILGDREQSLMIPSDIYTELNRLLFILLRKRPTALNGRIISNFAIARVASSADRRNFA